MDRRPSEVVDMMTTTLAAHPSVDQAAKALLIRLASGHVASAAMQVVLQLGIADRLVAGPVSIERLAAETASSEDALYRVLRALASVGVFSEETPRTFALTRAGALLGSNGCAIRDQLRWMSHPLPIRASAEIMHSVRTGTDVIDTLTGSPLFALLAEDAALSECFHDAMTDASTEIVTAVLETYEFSGIDLLVDVGGGHGRLLSLVLSKYPAMRGVLFDRRDVVADAGRCLAAADLAGRFRIEAGDFFVSVPADGDAYVLMHILHDWDDVRALVILERIRAALQRRPSGRVIVIESLIAPGNRTDATKFADLTMLLCVGGRERTLEEYRALCARAGLELARTVASRAGASVLEARPA